MKNLILNTGQANEINSDRSKFKYYLDKPIILKEKESLSLQSINRINKENAPVYDEGIITHSGIEKDATSVSSLSVLTPNRAINFLIQFDDSSLCTVYNSQGEPSNGTGCIIIMHYWFDTAVNLEVGQIIATGKDYQVGDYVIINKNAFPEDLQISGDMELRLNITKVKNGIIKSQYGSGYVVSASSSMNTDPPTTADMYNRYTYNVPISQGLIMSFRTSPNTGGTVYILSVSYDQRGFGFEVGDKIYIDKKLVRPYKDTDVFTTPYSLTIQGISNYPPDTNTYLYENNNNYKIELSGLLFNPNTIMRSDASNDLLIYDKNIQVADDERLKETKIAELEPQIIQNMELKFSPVLEEASDFIISLKIS
jgi:hypothetical protein